MKLALVTGASSGLGKALCKALAKEGFSLIISARHKDTLEKLALELQTQVTCHAADLSDRESRKSLIDLIHRLNPDLIINNAGFGLYGGVLMHPLRDQMEMLEVNAHAVLEISIEAARSLLHLGKKGTIVNISSAAAFFTYPTFCIYAASKGFVNQFSLAFDAEMAPYGIRILTACPGQIDTGFRKRAGRGHAQKPSFFPTMSSEKAASIILSQIKQGKRLLIFHWPYRLLIFITRFLPNALIQKILKKSIQGRYVS